MAFDLDVFQQEGWEEVLSGNNVALFGRAGCGKSTLLRLIIEHGRRVHGTDHFGIIAWTTHAASLIGGQMLHKFLRLGIAELPKTFVLCKVRGSPFVRQTIMDTKLIVIDEVPHTSARWFTIFEYVVRQLAVAHKQSLPWGGVQLVGTFPWFSIFVVTNLTNPAPRPPPLPPRRIL